MRYRLRTLRPVQFSLLALFAVMTAAAIALAVERLPHSTAARVGPLAALLIGICFWLAQSFRKR